MKETQATPNHDNAKAAVLHMAAELGAKDWKFAFRGPTKHRSVNIPAWSQKKLIHELVKAKTKLGLSPDTPVLAIQEAGRDGFAVHRFFESLGIESLVVDSSSIEVPRRKRRVKTDRLDALKLLNLLRRWHGGEKTALHVLHVPTPSEEDARHLHRERNRLTSEKTRLTNRLRSLLVTQGPPPKKISSRLASQLKTLRDWNGSPLPSQLRNTLRRECQRLAIVEAQLSEIEAEQVAMVKSPNETRQAQTAHRLVKLKGIGPQTAYTLGHEFFWRNFNNRREVGSAAGLTGTPYHSGKSERDQGISKAGNARVRSLMIQAAWRWLQWQPNSKLSQWFQDRHSVGRRQRKVGIVALARKLLVALWKYLEFGEMPDGAVLAMS